MTRPEVVSVLRERKHKSGAPFRMAKRPLKVFHLALWSVQALARIPATLRTIHYELRRLQTVGDSTETGVKTYLLASASCRLVGERHQIRLSQHYHNLGHSHVGERHVDLSRIKFSSRHQFGLTPSAALSIVVVDEGPIAPEETPGRRANVALWPASTSWTFGRMGGVSAQLKLLKAPVIPACIDNRLMGALASPCRSRSQ